MALLWAFVQQCDIMRSKAEINMIGANNMKRKMCVLALCLTILSLSSCGNASDNYDSSITDTGTAEQASTSAQQSNIDSDTPTEDSLTDTSDAGSTLPEDAKNALYAYMKCDSYDSLMDCLLPTSAAEKAKKEKSVIGNYYFGFGPGSSCEDITITECSDIPKDNAERLGEFLSRAFSLQGITDDFTVQYGYETEVSAICSVGSDGYTDSEIPGLDFTRRLYLLKIKNDRWIVAPYIVSQTNNMEPIG